MRLWLMAALLALPALATPSAAAFTECRGGDTMESTVVAGYHVIPTRRAPMGWDVHNEDNGLVGLQPTNRECFEPAWGLWVITRWADTFRATVTPAVCTGLSPVCLF